MTQSHVTNFIHGKRSEATGKAGYDNISPETASLIGSYAGASAADIDAAVDAARQAFPVWSNFTPSARALALSKLADAVEDRIETLAALESEDAGKPISQVKNSEIAFVIDNFRYFAGAGRNLEGRAAGEYASGLTSFVRREPVGVIGQVCPWNYPLMMAAWKLGPALAAGNAVVIKPAAETPRSLLALAEIAAEFLPAGAFNVIVGGRAEGAALVSHPGVDMVSVTGSTQTGIAVAQAAATGVKRAHLELGGNAPVIIHKDADLDFAVPRILRAGLFNAGQDCTAATRILVDRSIHDDVVSRLAAAAANVKLGALADAATTMGPLISKAQRERVLEFLDMRVESSQIVCGGEVSERAGWYLAPTIVVGATQSDPIVQEEIFGPVITVQAFDTEEQSLEMANGVRQGLASSIWTQHLGTAMRATKALRFGAVWVNAHGGLVSEMPHGGIGSSGYGRDLSIYGVEDYTELKHVMVRL